MDYALDEAEFRTPRGSAARFRYRIGTNDWNTLTACLTEDEYELRPLAVTGHAVDIGGYLGGVGIGLAIDNPGLRVTIIEPVPPNVELIRWAIDANGVADRVTLLDWAAGGPKDKATVISYGYRGNATLEHHAFVGNSSLASDAVTPNAHDELVVACIALGSLGDIDFLKIDCEGCEWSVLTDPATARIGRIHGEWHNTGGHSRDDLLALLIASHDVTFSGPIEGPGGFAAVLR